MASTHVIQIWRSCKVQSAFTNAVLFMFHIGQITDAIKNGEENTSRSHIDN